MCRVCVFVSSSSSSSAPVVVFDSNMRSEKNLPFFFNSQSELVYSNNSINTGLLFCVLSLSARREKYQLPQKQVQQSQSDENSGEYIHREQAKRMKYKNNYDDNDEK